MPELAFERHSTSTDFTLFNFELKCPTMLYFTNSMLILKVAGLQATSSKPVQTWSDSPFDTTSLHSLGDHSPEENRLGMSKQTNCVR